MRQVLALTGRLHLCLFPSSNVHADSYQAPRFSMFVHLHMATRFNPAHTSVSKRNAKLNIVISPLFNRLLERQPDLFAVVGMPSGNEVFKCDLSGNTEAQLGTARGRHPNLIFV